MGNVWLTNYWRTKMAGILFHFMEPCSWFVHVKQYFCMFLCTMLSCKTHSLAYGSQILPGYRKQVRSESKQFRQKHVLLVFRVLFLLLGRRPFSGFILHSFLQKRKYWSLLIGGWLITFYHKGLVMCYVSWHFHLQCVFLACRLL